MSSSDSLAPILSEDETSIHSNAMNMSMASYASNFTDVTDQSNNTKKTLSKNENKIATILNAYGNNNIAKQVNDLIISPYCSIKSLTVFGDNFKIIDKRTGEQYLVLEEGLIKGNVHFSKGIFPWNANSLQGSGVFVEKGKPDITRNVDFNGKIDTMIRREINIREVHSRSTKKHSCNKVLATSDEEIMSYNTRQSKKNQVIAGIKAIFNTAKDFEADFENAEGITGMAKEIAIGGLKAIPNAIKNFQEEFSPNKAINEHKEQSKKQSYLTQTPLYKDGLNLAYTDINCFLNNNSSFEDAERKCIYGLGRIKLKNCAYIGYTQGEKSTHRKNNLRSIKIMSSAMQEYPCIIAFQNGDLIYGTQKNNKIVKGYYYVHSENKMLPFDQNMKSLCKNIDNLSSLTTEQKQVIIDELKTSMSFRIKRSVNDGIKDAYDNLHDNITENIFRSNINSLINNDKCKNNPKIMRKVLEFSGKTTLNNNYDAMTKFNHQVQKVLIDNNAKIEDLINKIENKGKNKIEKEDKIETSSNKQMNNDSIFASLNTITKLKFSDELISKK